MRLGYASSIKAFERSVCHLQSSDASRSRAWLRVDETSVADEATIYIYDEITFWGVTAKDVAQQIQAIKAKTINLRINSPGGFVHDGTAIFNLLRQHSARIVTFIDGMAASIASIVAMAGDEIRIAANATVMIHDPLSILVGTAEELRAEAAVLDLMKDQMVATYGRHSKLKPARIADLMKEETWMSAEQAVQNGFATSIVEETAKEAALEMGRFDLSGFQHAPQLAGHDKPNTESANKRRTPTGLLRKRQAFLHIQGDQL